MVRETQACCGTPRASRTVVSVSCRDEVHMFQRKFVYAVLALLFVFAFPDFGQAAGQAFYIRAGASGSKTGLDWANAFSEFPTSLRRGAVYYVASGDYGTCLFRDPADGQLITIRKASREDHGVETGWQSSYSDGPATFRSLTFTTSDWLVDGHHGQWDPTNPKHVPYGFCVRQTTTVDNSHQITLGAYNNIIENLTFVHVEAYFTNTPLTGTWAKSMDVLYAFASHVTVRWCWFHDAGRELVLLTAQSSAATVEYSVLERNGQAQLAMNWPTPEHASIMANYASDATVRWSVIRDWRSTGGVIQYGSGPTLKFYGNTVTVTAAWLAVVERSNANGFLNAVSAATDVEATVYNNTFVDIPYGGYVLTIGSYRNRTVQNNVFYSVLRAGALPLQVTAETRSHNWYFNCGDQVETAIQRGTGDPFTDRVNHNYRPAGLTDSGYPLAQPFDIDPDGRSRSLGGRWQRGAFSGPLTPPANIRLVR